MPFTPEMRRKVDQIRDYLYGGGYPDPLTNAEQLSYLFFFYMIEGIDSANLRQAKATGQAYKSLFAGDWTLRNPRNAPAKGIENVPRERMRWSSWANALSGEQLVTWVRDEVFPFFAEIGDAYGMSFMAQARLVIDEPTVLTQVCHAGERAAAGKRRPRHQGRFVRACIAANQAGWRAGSVPHTAAYYSRNR